MPTPNDSPHLDDPKFWTTLKRYAAKIGRAAVVSALTLYYTLNDKDTPAWARTVIVSALIYLVSPVDIIPDFIPGGLTDDMGVIAAAAAVVAAHIKTEHRTAASAKADEWF
jgi:uncharacterized membrane protein YkvA (DUF1232 family)